MDIFIIINPMSIIVSYDKPSKRTRLYAQANGLNFYLSGTIGKRRDAVNHAILTEAIAQGRRAMQVHLV